MTPKEKAIELVEKYRVESWVISRDHDKQCALIAVYEVIATFIPKNNRNYLCEEIDFWQNVKTEIENL